MELPKVAIAFGSTHSGCAYSLSDSQNDTEIRAIGLGHLQETKTITTLLLERNHPHQFVSFGRDALKEYDSTQHYLFENIQLQAMLSSTSTIKPVGEEQGLNAEIVFSQCLTHFKDCCMHALDACFQRKIRLDDIRWVITVPDFWKSAMPVMTTAARNAGLIVQEDDEDDGHGERQRKGVVQILWESQCSCLNALDRWSKDVLRTDDILVTIDSGGFSTDVNVHRILKNNEGRLRFVEAQKVQTTKVGAAHISEKIMKILASVFGQYNFIPLEGTASFSSFKSNVVSCVLRWKQDNPISFSLQGLFDENPNFSPRNLKDAIQEYNHNVDQSLKLKIVGRRLYLPAQMMTDIMHQVIDPIMKFVNPILSKYPVKYLMLTGGFSSCSTLREQVESQARALNLDYFSPTHSYTAVFSGALSYLLDDVTVASSPSDHRAVVAIDFGTANSGCAYIIGDELDSDNEIQLVNLHNDGNKTKVPTMLVLHKSFPHDIVGFGAGVLNNFDSDQHLLFSRFKMQLYDKPEVKTLRADIGDAQLPTELVIGRCLEYMKNRALEQIRSTTSLDLTADEVKWVVTAPAMWSQQAKNAMVKASKIAGLVSDMTQGKNFMLANEPECAALSVLYQHQTKFKNDDKYLVFDCGGGTIDVAMHQIKKDDKGQLTSLHEFKSTRGLDLGSTRIDGAVLDFLDQLFDKKVESFKTVTSERFAFMASTLESAKNSWKQGGALSISLNDFSSQIYDIEGGLAGAVSRYNHSPVDREKLTSSSMRLKFPATLAKSFFDEAIGPTMELAEKLLKQTSGIKYLFVVGGFASSRYLQACLKQAIVNAGLMESTKLLSVMNPSVAVVQGAARYGMNPDIVQHRIAYESIGIECETEWNMGIMPISWRSFDHDTQSWKVYQFSVLIKNADYIQNSNSIIERQFYPCSKDSEYVYIKFVATSSKTIPVLTKEPGVTCLGQLKIPVTPGVSVRANPINVRIEIGLDVRAFVKSECMDHEECYHLAMSEEPKPDSRQSSS